MDQWARSVEPLGLTGVPHTKAELDKEFKGFFDRNELRVDDTTRKVIKFIRNPGLPVLVRPIYKLLFAAAVVSLRPEHRKMLGLRTLPKWIVVPVTRVSLRALQVLIGPDSPIEDGALNRLRRIGLIK